MFSRLQRLFGSVFVPKYVTTLSFHDQDIRMVAAKSDQGVFMIHAIDTVPLDPDVMVDGYVKNTSGLLKALSLLQKKHNPYKVHVVIPSNHMWSFGYPITIPYGVSTTRAIDEFVPSLLQKYTGHDPYDLEVQISVLHTWSGGVYVHIVALYRPYIETFTTLLKQLRIKVASVKTHMQAIAEKTLGSNKSVVLVDVGSRSIRVGVADNGRIFLGDAMSGGVAQMYQFLSRRLGAGRDDQVLSILWDHGVAETHKDPYVKEVLQSMLSPVVRWIDDTFMSWHSDRYNGNHVRNPIAHGYVFGDAATLPGLVRYMTRSTRIPMQHPDAWKDFANYTRQEVAPMHARDVVHFGAPITTTMIELANEK